MRFALCPLHPVYCLLSTSLCSMFLYFPFSHSPNHNVSHQSLPLAHAPLFPLLRVYPSPYRLSLISCLLSPVRCYLSVPTDHATFFRHNKKPVSICSRALGTSVYICQCRITYPILAIYLLQICDWLQSYIYMAPLATKVPKAKVVLRVLVAYILGTTVLLQS